MIQHRWYEAAPLPIRLSMGIWLMYHGYPKLFTEMGHENIVHLISGYQVTIFGLTLTVPFPDFFAWLAGILEFGGGIAFILGGFVCVFGFLLAVQLCGNVFFRIVMGDSFPQPLPGYQPLPTVEDSMLYIAGSVALVIGGAGAWSLTRMVVPRPLV